MKIKNEEVDVRLTEYEIKAIKSSFLDVFGVGSIYLFGSRVEDSKKGGDIDLYIVPNDALSRDQLLAKKIDFLVSVKNLIGEQKIDVIMATNENRLIEQEALNKGIKL
ncbi:MULTISPECIES: nucleotidyltransferase domain-containing protein [Cysteiniphilum]|uniref:nucleotidyltransferase domain-containing protein n=1 Tax=Cysteiniphilum TaxID=2056696 RepID=UPI0019D47987|nr:MULTISPECIES: nucleotidyltransferase domain-containing protein [Cysteiniphilum]